MLKILQINKFYYPWLGGVEQHVKDLSEGLVKKGFRVTALCCNDRFKTVQETVKGVKVTRIASPGILFSMPMGLTLHFWLKKSKADIYHFHWPYPMAALACFFARPKGKVVITWHSDIIRQRLFGFLLSPLIFWFLKRADAITVNSPQMIESSRYLKYFKKKCFVCHHGINIDAFKSTQEIKKKTQAIKAKLKTPMILGVGRFIYYKGFEYLIRAMALVKKAHLILIGEGKLEYRLKDLSRKLGLEDHLPSKTIAGIPGRLLLCS
jgi:glycosyltransferase involved in cell wall biosynthesis